MTCKKELERRLKMVFPKLDECESEYIMDTITLGLTPLILGDYQKADWDLEYIKPELLPSEPTEEIMLSYTE
jgi:hypothetical protein